MLICPKCRSELNTDDFHCPACGFTPKANSGYLEFAPELAISNDGFSSKLYPQLFNIENNLFWFRYRNKLLQYLLGQYFPEAKSFCEIGCGTGYVLSGLESYYSTIRYTGSDIYTNALSFAASRVPQAKFIQADIYRFPFSDEFDVTGAFDVLEHIADDTLALENIYRATKSGGGTMITVPRHKWLWSVQDEAACHKRRYSRIELKKKIESVGFHIEQLSSFISLLVPFMIIDRLKNHIVIKNRHDPMTELKISATLNTLFYKICMIEYGLIKKGINFPAGGSLVCVARKRKR